MASLEQTLERLIAAIEAHTAVLATTTATQPTTTQPTTTQPKSNGAVHPTPPAVTKRGPGRPPKAVAAPSPAPTLPKPEPEPEPDDGGLDDDDFGSDGGLDDDDDSGPDDPAPASTPTVTPEEAKQAVFSFRDALIARDGKDKALPVVRTLLRKHVKSIDHVNEGNAAAVYAAFSRGE